MDEAAAAPNFEKITDLHRLSEPEDVDEMVTSVEREMGGLDILVHNAATGGFRSLMSAMALA